LWKPKQNTKDPQDKLDTQSVATRHAIETGAAAMSINLHLNKLNTNMLFTGWEVDPY
jgi:hypothetical protein